MMKTTTPTTMVSQMRQAFGQDGFCGAIIAVLLTDWTARVTQKKPNNNSHMGVVARYRGDPADLTVMGNPSVTFNCWPAT